MHGRREVQVPKHARKRERHDDAQREHRASATELTAVLRVREPPPRQERVSKNLRERPADRKQGERERERGTYVESEHGGHDGSEFEQSKW